MRLGGIRGISIVVGLAALAVIGVACSTNGEAASNNVGGTGSVAEVRAPSSAAPTGAGSAQVSGQIGQSGPAGIWVTGRGSIELVPDLAAQRQMRAR